MTARELFAQISAAAHITIVPEPGVQLRRLTVAIQRSTAAQALDSICELCGWAWNTTPNHVVTVHRKQFQTASMPASVGKAIVWDLPPDLRRFLGVGVALEPRLTSRWLQGVKILPGTYRSFKANQQWLGAAQRYLSLVLRDQVLSAMAVHTPLSFAALSPKYRSMILSALYLNAIPSGELYSFGGPVTPLAADPWRAALVRAQDGTLHLQSAPGGTSGFAGEALGSAFHLK